MPFFSKSRSFRVPFSLRSLRMMNCVKKNSVIAHLTVCATAAAYAQHSTNCKAWAKLVNVKCGWNEATRWLPQKQKPDTIDMDIWGKYQGIIRLSATGRSVDRPSCHQLFSGRMVQMDRTRKSEWPNQNHAICQSSLARQILWSRYAIFWRLIHVSL